MSLLLLTRSSTFSPGVLKVWTGTSWQKVGCGGAAPPAATSFDQVDDDFSGSAGALNGRTVNGRTWVADSGLQLNGSGKVVNNGAQYTAVGRVSPVGSAGDDLTVTLVNLTVDTGYAGGLELARDGSGNQYQVNLNRYDLTVVLYRNGVVVGTASVPSTVNVNLSARIRSGVVTVNVGGTDRITYTDSSPLTGRGCGFFLQQLGANSADAFLASVSDVTYTLEFDLSSQDPVGARQTSLWDVYCNGSYAGQATSPDPANNTDLGENDGPAPYGDEAALWHLNTFPLPTFDPAANNHIQLGYTTGLDYGHVRAIRVTGSDGSIWYGEYPLGVKYGLDTYNKSKIRGGLVAGSGDYWLGGDGDFVPYQYNAATGAYDSYPQDPSGSPTGEMHIYFSVPEGAIGRLRLQLPDGSWIREACDSDTLERHPLKIQDPANPGSWITVACMVPAEGLYGSGTYDTARYG